MGQYANNSTDPMQYLRLNFFKKIVVRKVTQGTLYQVAYKQLGCLKGKTAWAWAGQHEKHAPNNHKH